MKGLHVLRFSPDGALLAGTGVDGSIQIWSVKDRKALCFFKDVHTREFHFAFSPDSKRLVSMENGGRRTANGRVASLTKVWDLATGKEKASLDGPPICKGVQFLDDTRVLVAGSIYLVLLELSSGKMYSLDVSALTIDHEAQTTSPVRCMCLSEDRKLLAVGNDRGAGTLHYVHCPP